MKSSLIVSYVFSFLLAFNLQGQSIIKGVIKSNQSKEVLEGASIYIVDSQDGTITDENGLFTLSTNQSFPFNLNISYIGYNDKLIKVVADSDLIILLDEGILLGEELVISASRKKERKSEAPASISVLEGRRIKLQALSNPTQALRNMQGVDVTMQGIDHFQVNLRGRMTAFTTETYYMKDFRNILVPGQGFIALGRTSVSDLDMDRIEVVRGPGSALYGPGVESGVVHFISKSPSKFPGQSISIGTGTQSNINIEARHAQIINDKWAYKIIGKFNQADDFILDPNDPTDAESLAAFQPVVISGLTGELLSETNELEDQVKSYGLMGELEYKYNDATTIFFNGGYNYRRGVVRADLGEALQDFGNYFTQLRLTSSNFFAQAYMNGSIDDSEESVLYRTGITSISKYKQFQVQGQYDWPVIENKWEVNLGGEIQLLRSNTEGTVHGRFEEDDNFDIYSAYVQSKYAINDDLDFLAAARIDQFSAIDATRVSPRLGLIYAPNPTSSFRLTYNRSNSAPSALFVFADIPFGVSPLFDIPFLGGIQPISFSDPVVTQSFIGADDYEGTDLSLTVPYAIAVAGLAEDFPVELIDYLNSKIPTISTTTLGTTILNGQPISVLPSRDKIQPTETNAFEIGYKGVVGNKLSIGADVYYTQKKNLIFSSELSPLVIYPNLTSDLVNTFNQVTSDDELAAFGLDQATLSSIIASIGDGLAESPLGIISPDVEYPSDNPQFIVSPINSGEVDYFGMELSLQYYFSDRLSAFTNYNWLSQNFFDDVDLGVEGTGQAFALNTAEHRIRMGFDYIPDGKGFNYGLSARYQNEMQAMSGTIFMGTLPAYTIVDASIGYDFGNGFRLNMTAQNILDEAYRVMPRMPKIGRLVLVKAVYEM